MYPQYQLMKPLQDERLRAAARDHLAAEARRARAILLFPQGIIPAGLKLAHARGRIWLLNDRQLKK